MQTQGVMIGHFEPFHLGHVRSVLHAAGQVEHLHVCICPHPAPNSKFVVTLQDKARWLQLAFKDLPFIHVHVVATAQLAAITSTGIHPDDANATVNRLVDSLGLPELPVLFWDEHHPLSNMPLTLACQVTPHQTAYNSERIIANPAQHFAEIHPAARENYTQTLAIVGGESSGKTTLVHKLANYYGATYALEMGRLYVHTDLGGSELALQYSDYLPIALDHAQAIREAKRNATAAVTIVDTDFVTTQAFCEEYEERTHPFVATCIDEMRLDHTLLLANNVPWVADGMRSLGGDAARHRFAQRLQGLYAQHQIKPYMIKQPNYEARFKTAIDYIEAHVYGNA